MNAKLKTLSRIFAVILSAIIMITLVSCADNGGADSTPAPASQNQTASVSDSSNQAGTTKTFTVQFNSKGGGAVPSQTIENGSFATAPADPKQDNFIFAGWAKDEAGTTLFDFEKDAITADITLYAVWEAASGDACVAKFYLNDGTDTVFETKNFNKGSRIAQPATPTNGTSKFDGWYQQDGTAYAPLTKYNASVNFYAKWLAQYKLEAEDTQLIGLDPEEDVTATADGLKKGYGRSGNMAGSKMISEDASASGGKFVRGLYYTNAYLAFKFTADKAGSAKLYASFACEFKDYDLTSQDIGFEVNGTFVPFTETIKLQAYDLHGGIISFTEFYIADVELQAGENVIRLVMINKNKVTPFPDGTVKAPAPIVDCLSLYTETEIVVSKYNNFPTA